MTMFPKELLSTLKFFQELYRIETVLLVSINSENTETER